MTKFGSKAEKEYYRPEVEKGITSGNKQLDLLYKNQWLFDFPVIGDKIRKLAKSQAENSGGKYIETNPEFIKSAAKYNTDSNYYYTGRLNEQGDFEVGKNLNKVSLVDQYFSDKPLFPASIYKPTSDYLTFLPTYSLKSKNIDGKKINDIINEQLISLFVGNGATSYKEVVNKYNNFLNTKKPVFGSETLGINTPLERAIESNLGHHKVGMAWDKELDLPYLSISDAWDFSPDSYAKIWNTVGKVGSKSEASERERQALKIQASLMHRAGHPFKVYDRFYFNPETKEYISDDIIQGRKSLKSKEVLSKLGISPINLAGINKYVK